MKLTSFVGRAFRDKYLAAAVLFFAVWSVPAHAQFAYQVHVAQWYDLLKIEKLLQFNTTDTTAYPAASYPGAVVFRRQVGDTSLYVSNGLRYVKVASGNGNAIQNQTSNQTGAVFNVDRGLINQASDAGVATQFPSSKAAPLVVQGGAGASTSFNSGTTAQAASANGIQIYAGGGGNQTGAAVTSGGGGKGGDADLRGGPGGLAVGAGTTSGSGGNVTLQGGDIGSTNSGVNPGIAGYAKIAGGSASAGSKGDGGDIFLIPGQHYVSGYRDGDVMLGTSPAGPVVRGRVLVSFPQGTPNPNTQNFQVNGTSWLGGLVTLPGITSAYLKTDASGNIIAGGANDFVTNQGTSGPASSQSGSMYLSNNIQTDASIWGLGSSHVFGRSANRYTLISLLAQNKSTQLAIDTTGTGTGTPYLQVGNSFNDLNSNYIGIGTRTPTSLLHVAGSATVQGALNLGVGSNTATTAQFAANSKTMYITMDANGNGTGGTELWIGQSNTSGITFQHGTGNMGVNTATPSYSWDVNGSIRAGSSLFTGGLSAGLVTATDANYTQAGNKTGLFLPTITANRTLTLAAGGAGQILILINLNTAAFTWQLAGTAVKLPNGTAVTSLTNGTSYILYCDGTTFYKIN